MNIRIARFIGTHTNDPEHKKQLNMQTGILSSTLEHAVPEQMFTTDPNNPADAVSAVKALQKATQAGQRIYHITSANQATALQNINHAPDTMAEINAALQVGKEVITHTDTISVPGWSGAGYIIQDPQTGDGSYKISGGYNGGVVIIFTFVIITLAALLATSLIGGVFGILIAFFQVLSLYKYSAQVADIANDQDLSPDELAANVNDLSFLYSLSALTTLLAPLWQGAGSAGTALDAFLTGFIATFLMMQ